MEKSRKFSRLFCQDQDQDEDFTVCPRSWLHHCINIIIIVIIIITLLLLKLAALRGRHWTDLCVCCLSSSPATLDALAPSCSILSRTGLLLLLTPLLTMVLRCCWLALFSVSSSISRSLVTSAISITLRPVYLLSTAAQLQQQKKKKEK